MEQTQKSGSSGGGWFIDSHHGNIKEQYHFIEKIASGGFGVVYLAEHRTTKAKVAIKAIQKKRVKDYLTFQNEIKLLRILDHPNIIKLYEIWEWNEVCFLVIEYCEGGELFHYIIQNKHLNEREAAKIMRQLFAALRYLHSNSISHRDIKPENFMLKSKDNTQCIKLIDFGLSKDYSGQAVMSTPSGSPYYIAPEVFQQNYTSNSMDGSVNYNKMLKILQDRSVVNGSCKVPFPGRNELEIITNVVKGEFHFNHDAFKNVSADCKDLICHLLVKDVNKRYSAEEAYNHKWIQQFGAEDGDSELDKAGREQLPQIVFQEMQDTVQQMRLRKAALTELASRVPEKNYGDFKEALAMHDRGRTGKLPSDQFVRCLHLASMNATQREIELLISELDQKNTGIIEYDEFVNCCFLSYLFQKEYKLRLLFEECDKDKQGIITLTQLRIILKSEEINLSPEQLDRIFKEELGVDLSQIAGDDPISYDLFLTCLRNYNKSK